MENEEKKPDLTEKAEISAPAPAGEAPSPAQEKEPARFDVFDWLAVAMGVALGALWFRVFSLESLVNVPGLGTTAFVLAALAAECVYLRGKLRPTRAGLFLTVCTVLLAIAAGLFPDWAVRMLDLALLAFLTPASALALAGRGFPALKAAMVRESTWLFLPNLFRHFPKPFQALRRRKKGWNGFWVVLLTLLVLVPVFGVVLSLLAGADQVFEAMLGDVGAFIRRTVLQWRFLWDWLKAAVLGLMLFSFLYSLARPVPEREAAPGGGGGASIPCLPFIAGLAALDLIYGVFAVIQFVFLFGGAETAAMQGGFAQYARQGFFQLAAVAGINLCAALVCSLPGGRGKKAVNALVYVLIGLTAVILVSALYRMCLYIGVYGLSLLRCGTLLIMAWIAVALAAVTVRTAKPGFRVFPVFFCAFLLLWLGFNYCNIDAVIAGYNEAAYRRGDIQEFDRDYVRALGPDAARNASNPWPDRVLFPQEW